MNLSMLVRLPNFTGYTIRVTIPTEVLPKKAVYFKINILRVAVKLPAVSV